MKIKEVIEDLKLKKLTKKKKKKKRMIVKIVKIYLGLSLVLLRSFNFWIVPWSSLYLSRSIGPFLCSQY